MERPFPVHGEIWPAWWLDRASPKSTSLIYRETYEEIDWRDLAPSSVLYDVEGKDYEFFLNQPDLLEDIRVNGQKEPILAVRHNLSVFGPNTGMFSSPMLDRDHILEGHHRYAVARKLDIPLKARVFHVLVFPASHWPSRWEDIYNHKYDEKLWTLNQTWSTKEPWFHKHHFDDFVNCPKDIPLKKCFEFVKSLNIPLRAGIDYGCAEGAYAYWASQYLGIQMVGMDAEPSRVLRANLWNNVSKKGCRAYVQNFDEPWEDPVEADFGMCLSVSHWLKDWEASFSQMERGKRVMIVEVRSKDPLKPADLFVSRGFTGRSVAFLEPDRHFYVMWRNT